MTRPGGAVCKRHRRVRRHVLALGLALVGVSTTALSTNEPVSRSSGEVRVLKSSGSSLARLAAEVGALAIGEASLVVVGALDDGELDAKDQLWEALRTQVASAVPLFKTSSDRPLSPAEARLEARRAGLPLVYLAPEFTGGHLDLTVTVTKWRRSFWQRTLEPLGTTLTTLRLRVEADSSVRALFVVPDKLFTKIETIAGPLGAPLAVACGDVGSDGSLDVVLFDRRELVVGRIEDSKFKVSARKPWSELSPVSATPLRAPLGAVRIENGSIEAGLSDRAHLIRVNGDLNLETNAPRAFPSAQGECWPFSATGLVPKRTSCFLGAPPKPSFPTTLPPTTTTTVDAASEFVGTQPDGSEITVSAVVDNRNDEAAVEFISTLTRARRLSLPNTGAVVYLADIDGNGSPEVLSSSTQPGEKDSLRVHSYHHARLNEVAKISGGPVHAVTACPFNGHNPLTIIAAMGNQLKVVR